MNATRTRLLAVLLSATTACAAYAAPAPAPAPDSYTAETTYRKLVAKYPFIKVASVQVPATVEAFRDITYTRIGDRALQLDLYLPAQRSGKAVPATSCSAT